MNQEELFDRILDEKVVIDPLLYLVKIQDKVDKNHEEYTIAMAERWQFNAKILSQLEQYFELWEIKKKE